ncbi:hypothetical protein POJ06DRAFT_194479 [Lipomyces tetrasporus]|uniref:Zn(2)-C6 fungal-type domain-containing protein n=1 Tax=Lipomyces tetrasporus TaxID=54092 RepID=A0AAD7QUF5_9ASCO|nr:uncharacterized protein POJ06DRAFT_194479 [Lipomyces tetrasporus]KAJ8101644.1 hypothetical protein POJ06DRAFT_194479 [Lipomyces tetrasporus]
MPQELRVRRNGQSQACEVCRLSKIRCDHATPVCGRCALRGLICVYHSAPMTRSRNTTSRIETLPKKRSYSYNPSLTLKEQQPSLHVNHRPAETSVFVKAPTHYGTTRLSAVFSASQAGFDSVIPDTLDEDIPASQVTAGNFNLTTDRDAAKRAQVKQAGKILLSFPTPQTCEVLLQHLDTTIDIHVSPTMIRQCLQQVWSEYGCHLSHPRSTKRIMEMSSDLCQNGKSPIVLSDEVSWYNWFGGPYLRWEMIAVLYSYFGLAFKCLQEWDPVFELPELQGLDRNTAAEKMRVCAAECLKVCENIDTKMNDIMVIALKNTWKLHSMIAPEGSNEMKPCSGVVISASVTAGLHRLALVTDETPLSEHRTALSAYGYFLDKSESIFNGRPPMLTLQYCIYRLPLDLSEDDLYGTPEEFASGKARLDSNGWDTSGRIHTTTWVRAQCLQIPIREEIVELAIGVNVHFTKQQIDNLNTKLDEVVASYPAKIQYRNRQHWVQKKAARELYIVTWIHLDVLRCRFLIERLNVSRSYSTGQALLDVAQEIMKEVLWFWLNRDELLHFNYSFDALVVYLGIPSSGVLCEELIKSTKQDQGGASLNFLRSDVIQSLTMFVGFLEWIRPTDSNYKLCWKLSKAIKRIVDSVLNAPSLTIQSQQQQAQSQTYFDSLGSYNRDSDVIQDESLAVGMDDLDDLNWMSTIDWTQGEWLDMNQ